MASNNMYVVMYRIIAYLYDCMRGGVEPMEHEYSAETLGIPEPYWRDVMKELRSHHFTDGVMVTMGSVTMCRCASCARPSPWRAWPSRRRTQ